jgi:hypothetical protein
MARVSKAQCSVDLLVDRIVMLPIELLRDWVGATPAFTP